MKVRSDRAAEPAALESRAAVVAESVYDPAEGLGAFIENRLARMILEARDLECSTRLEAALEQDVADHPYVSGDGLMGEQPGSWHERSVTATVAAPQELVSAADRQ